MVPYPTICPRLLMPVATWSVHPKPLLRKLLRSRIVPFSHSVAWATPSPVRVLNPTICPELFIALA